MSDLESVRLSVLMKLLERLNWKLIELEMLHGKVWGKSKAKDLTNRKVRAIIREVSEFKASCSADPIAGYFIFMQFAINRQRRVERLCLLPTIDYIRNYIEARVNENPRRKTEFPFF